MPIDPLTMLLIAKGIGTATEYFKPDRADIFKNFTSDLPESPDLPKFEDIPELSQALSEAVARTRDPGIYEQAVRFTGRQFAPVYQRQIEEIKSAYSDNPAMLNKALERLNQNFANVVRGSLDEAILREEQAKESARRDVASLAGIKLESDRAAEMAKYQADFQKAQIEGRLDSERRGAEYEDRVRVWNYFSDIFGDIANIAAYKYGRGDVGNIAAYKYGRRKGGQ